MNARVNSISVSGWSGGPRSTLSSICILFASIVLIVLVDGPGIQPDTNRWIRDFLGTILIPAGAILASRFWSNPWVFFAYGIMGMWVIVTFAQDALYFPPIFGPYQDAWRADLGLGLNWAAWIVVSGLLCRFIALFQLRK